MAKAKRPAVGVNPNIDINVQRELRKVAQYAFDAQDRADEALGGLTGKVSKTNEDLLDVSRFVRGQVQAGGAYPMNITGLPGQPQFNPLNKQGPGAGTYVVGAKLTITGTNGSITIDSTGRITAIQPAT